MGKTQQFMWFEWFQTSKIESLRHSKLVCDTKVATLRFGHLSFFWGDFFHLSWNSHLVATNWDLWWPASRAIYEPTHRRCHLFLESLGWLIKDQEITGDVGDVDGCFCKMGCFFFWMLILLRKPNRDCEILCWKVWGVWSVRIGK